MVLRPRKSPLVRSLWALGCAAWALAMASAAIAVDAVVAYKPALSRTSIAFTHGGELWLVDRSGGQARCLTAGAHIPASAGNAFSPDGSLLAYSAAYDGVPNVYVMAVHGGDSRRLTFDGVADEVVGWSEDGTEIYFRSARDTFYPEYGLPRVYAVPLKGGPVAALPFPVAYNVAYSPTRAVAAVEPQQLINLSWKQYRGGDQRQILLVDPKSLKQDVLPGPLGNDYDPMWIGENLYFLSDRDGRTTLYVWKPQSGVVTRLVDPGEWDVKDASLGPDAIVLSQLTGLSLYFPESGKIRKLDIGRAGQVPAMPQMAVDLSRQVMNGAVSDEGDVALEGRGRTLVIDGSGHVTVYGASDHVQRAPSFSGPKRVTFFSDESGTNQLGELDIGTRRRIEAVHFEESAYFQAAVWSPDGNHVALLDMHQNIWVAIRGQAPRKIDREARYVPRMAWATWDASWSAHGERLSYSRSLPSGLNAVFVWSTSDGMISQASPSEVDAQYPAWDGDGRRLWFTASNTTSPVQNYLDQSDRMRPPALRRVFWTEPQGDSWRLPTLLPVPARRYEGLFAGSEPGQLLILETVVPPGEANFSQAATQTLDSVDADSGEVSLRALIEGIGGFYPGDLYGHFTTSLRASPGRSRRAARSRRRTSSRGCRRGGTRAARRAP